MGTGAAVAEGNEITHTKMNLKLESVINADVEVGAVIAWTKMAALTAAHILVGDAANDAVDVAVTGDISIDNAGVTAIGAGAVDLAMVDPASLDGTIAKVVADDNVIGGMLVLHRIDVADVTGDTDVTLTHKTRVIDAWGLNTGGAAHATTDTWQVKNTANAISDAVQKTAVVNAVIRIKTIDPATAEIPGGGILRIAAAKTTNAAVTVYVLGIRVA